MKTDKIIIANVKCTGCATTIEKELRKIAGVSTVAVDVDHDLVTVSYEDGGRGAVVSRLRELGYPEATAENGLLLQLKSYASCMIGKVSNLSDKWNQQANSFELAELINDKRTTIVDVRTAAEFQHGSINGAVNVPLPQLSQRLKELRKMRGPLVLCCASGNRSAQAKKYLVQEGIECVDGGSWLKLNLKKTKIN